MTRKEAAEPAYSIPPSKAIGWFEQLTMWIDAAYDQIQEEIDTRCQKPTFFFNKSLKQIDADPAVMDSSAIFRARARFGIACACRSHAQTRLKLKHYSRFVRFASVMCIFTAMHAWTTLQAKFICIINLCRNTGGVKSTWGLQVQAELSWFVFHFVFRCEFREKTVE